METILLIIAVLCAFIVKGLCGFANTLVFTTISGFAISNVTLSPIELLLSFPSNIIMAFKNRRYIQFKTASFLSILLILGAIPGALFLKGLDQSFLKIFFGIVVVLVSIEMLLRKPSKNDKKQNIFFTVVAGLISGLLCGLFGAGALLAAYVSRITKDMDTFKGTLNLVFTVDSIFRIILYGVGGILTLNSFATFLWLCPFMIIGLFIGMNLTKIIDEKRMRLYVIVLLIISGISLIITNIF